MNIWDDDGYNENNESDRYYDRSHKRKRQKVLIWDDDRKPPKKLFRSNAPIWYIRSKDNENRILSDMKDICNDCYGLGESLGVSQFSNYPE